MVDSASLAPAFRVAAVVVGAVLAALAIRWIERNGLRPAAERRTYAVFLVVMQVIYVGFVVVSGQSAGALVETTLLAAFTAVALAGLKVDDRFLLVGYLAHGAWDLWHLFTPGPYVVPLYPEACVGFDWLLLIYLVFRIGRWRQMTSERNVP